jgi:hypothetical protein
MESGFEILPNWLFSDYCFLLILILNLYILVCFFPAHAAGRGQQ